MFATHQFRKTTTGYLVHGAEGEIVRGWAMWRGRPKVAWLPMIDGQPVIGGFTFDRGHAARRLDDATARKAAGLPWIRTKDEAFTAGPIPQ